MTNTTPSDAVSLEKMVEKQDVDICVCTYQRPQIAEILMSLNAMTGLEGLRMRIIVADNDDTPSAQDIVAETAQKISVPVHYVHAPRRNISLARNACLDAANATWVAWVDDDEVVAPDWLGALLKTAENDKLDAVFGPAIAHYPDGTNPALVQNDFHSNRVPRRNGIVLTGHTCNALVRWDRADFSELRFDLGLGRIGGEDTDFFFRLHQAGAQMGLADTAEVYEQVEPRRLHWRWLVKRHFNAGVGFGSNVKRHAKGRDITGLGKLHGVKAPAKMVFCACAALACFPSSTRRLKWFMRGIMHAGVMVGILNLRGMEQY